MIRVAKKKFKLSAEQIKDLVTGHGRCIASDRITVGGLQVGVMQRDEPRDEDDSGWSFLSGDESQEYLDDPANAEIYEVNTIANYDPDIIPLLYAEPGSVFVRETGGPLLPEGELPSTPVRKLTAEWSFRINSCFRRRTEDEQLVFWAPGRTIWMSVWDAKKGESPAQRLAWIKKEANPSPVERFEPAHPKLKRFAYLLMETDDEKGARWALYTATVDPTGGHLWMAVYFDRKEDLEWARATWDSVEFRPQAGQ
jgi:hypothetical protein